MEQAGRMRTLALETGDQGYGAVIVKDGRIVGQAPSRVVVNRDSTAHAEMEAIRDAARNLGTRDLRDCFMYSTSRACPMCEAAAYWANLKSMSFGSSISDAGEPRLCRS
jgi:tRNA(Arg) A34 adenosine deaminase TadA